MMMNTIRRLGLVLLIGMLPGGVLGETRIAVIDFESAGRLKEQDVGRSAADLFELALQQEGFRVYERRLIKRVVQERDLDAAGLLKQSDTLRALFPQIDMLVKGTVRVVGVEKYELYMVAVSTHTGLTVMQDTIEGTFPELLWRGADLLREQTTAAGDATVVKRKGVPGFTDSPEAALIYYNGIAYLASGNPGAAVGCFAKAYLADPSFVLAQWWKMKTYERVGLPYVAQAVRDEIAGNLVGNRFLQQIDGRNKEGQKQRTVVLMVDGEQAGYVGDTIMACRKALAQNTAIQLLDVASLTDLGQEADLALSGYVKADSYMKSAVWALADHVVTFFVSPSGELSVALYDTLSGEVIDEQEFAPAAREQPQIDADRIIEAIVNGSESRKKKMVQVKAEGSDRMDWLYMSGSSSELNELLYRFQEGLKPEWALFELALWYEQNQPSYDAAVWQTLLENIDSETPGADLLYSTALWKLRLDNRHFGRYIMADYFQPLLDNYPESLAAKLCLFSMACEIREGGDAEKGAEMLLSLTDDIPGKLPRELRTFDIECSFYYQIARALFEAGQTQDARIWMQRAKKAMQGQPADSTRLRCRLGLGLDRNGNPDLVFSLNEMAGDGYANFISETVAALDRKINPGSTATLDSASLKQIMRRADKATGERVYRLKQEYLERCLTATGDDLEAVSMSKALRYLNWLIARTWQPAQRQPLLELGGRIRRHFNLPEDSRYRMVVGEYDAVLRDFGWNDEAFCMKYGYPAYVRKQYERYMSSPRYGSQSALKVADNCVGIGALTEALSIYTNVMASGVAADARHEAALSASRCYALQGDSFAAADVLHEVIRECEEEGKTAMNSTYAIAVWNLRHLRLSEQYGWSDPCWLYYNKESERYNVCSSWDPVFPLSSETNEIRDALFSIFRNYYWTYWEATPYRHYPEKEADAFVAAYGRDALPVLLQAYSRSQYGQDGSKFLTDLIGRIASPEDAPAVMKAFRKNPELAKVASRLAPEQTAAALVECMPALRFQYRIHEPLQEVVIENRISALYPILFMNIANEGAWSHTLLPRVADAMRECDDPELNDMFRQAIASFLSVGNDRQQKWVEIGGAALGVFKIAIEFGVIDGLRDLLDYNYLAISPKDRMAAISPSLAIPQSGDPEQMLALLKDNIGLLTWNAAAKKFVWVNGDETELYTRGWEQPVETQKRLISAIEDQDIDEVRLLLQDMEEGVASIKDSYGKSAMDCAVLRGNIDLVKLLQQHGGDITVKNSFGYSALNYAALRGNYEMCRYLLEQEAAVDTMDPFGYTPLHRAAQSNNRKLIRLFLEAGADATMRNKDGFTASELASNEVREWMAEVSKGAE